MLQIYQSISTVNLLGLYVDVPFLALGGSTEGAAVGGGGTKFSRGRPFTKTLSQFGSKYFSSSLKFLKWNK